MNRMVLQSRVGADGVLHISVPMGKAGADRDVQVTIDPIQAGSPPMTQEEWRQFVMETAGAWQGDLERLEPLEQQGRGDFSERTTGVGAEP